jgi:ribosomal protein S18 acetylase RimI-like enzyme
MRRAIRIRRLRLRDYDALIDLFQVCGLEPRTRGRDRRAAIASQLRVPRNRYFGAFDGHRLVGAVFGTHDSRKGWISRLAVHPDYRRRRLASRLVRTCEDGLRSQGIQMFAALIEPDNAASAAVFRSLDYEVMPMLYARRKTHDEV